MDAEDIKAHTNHVAYQMFLETADGNYLGARAAYFEERDWDFWWLTLHAVEKYLKTILLTNGQSAKRGGHDVVGLLRRVAQVDPRLKPPEFICPRFARDEWFDYPDQKFLERLNTYGSADNRYAVYGYTVRIDDLLRADQLIFWARRHANPVKLSVMGSGGERIEFDQIERLASSPTDWGHQFAGRPLEKLSGYRARVFRRLNAPFFPNTRHRLRFWRSASHEAALADNIHLIKNAEPGSAAHAYSRAVVQRALDNIYFSKSDRLELEGILRDYP